MERLTSHSYEAILVLVLLACFVLIAETAALFWSAVRLDRHRIRRSLPEIAALAVTLYITILLGGGWKLFLNGLPPYDWMAQERTLAGAAAICAGLFSMLRTPRRGGLLAAAGILSLPLFDIFLPISALFVLGLLTGRVLLLVRHVHARRAYEVTVAPSARDSTSCPTDCSLPAPITPPCLSTSRCCISWSASSGASTETQRCSGRS